uniref:NADH dehydrogenase subunit 6 n=1 Tax=Cerastoderma edule TaxID=55710 RepID=A0A343F4F6_CERED|nr:NADH dehydrogenase subunit 6 [Cerastoderma edule]ASQ40454.1 NADH dehydrogenase subunit 6 [Cerastoderma edule]
MSLALVFFCVLFLMFSSSLISHPISLMGGLLLLVALISVVLCSEVSAFYSFVLFMVVAGGMLVVFAYCTSLAPNPTFKLKSDKFPIFLGVLAVVISSFSDSESKASSNSIELMPTYDLSWGLSSVLLCILLFFIMVVVATCCSTNEGAMSSMGVG